MFLNAGKINAKDLVQDVNDERFAETKHPPEGGCFLFGHTKSLFYFCFCINHMLTDNRIKLFDFHFVGHVTLVFIGRTKVAGFSAGYQSDFISHSFLPV